MDWTEYFILISRNGFILYVPANKRTLLKKGFLFYSKKKNLKIEIYLALGECIEILFLIFLYIPLDLPHFIGIPTSGMELFNAFSL